MTRANLPPAMSLLQLTVHASVAPELKLNCDEMAILEAFRAMDDRRKCEALTRMERIAGTHPFRVAPRLRLINGSAN